MKKSPSAACAVAAKHSKFLAELRGGRFMASHYSSIRASYYLHEQASLLAPNNAKDHVLTSVSLLSPDRDQNDVQRVNGGHHDEAALSQKLDAGR
eukprot:271445-Pleurochrysis_carterae.AAC.1